MTSNSFKYLKRMSRRNDVFVTLGEDSFSMCDIKEMPRLGYSVVSLSSWNIYDLVDRRGVAKRADFGQFCQLFA